MKLAGKVAVVTGTSPNIGGGIATGLADEGAKLVCVDIRPDYAEQCAESIRRRSGDAISRDLRRDQTISSGERDGPAGQRHCSAELTSSSTTPSYSTRRASSICRSTSGTAR